MSAWRDATPRVRAPWSPVRFRVVGALLVGLLGAGLAAIMLAFGPSHDNRHSSTVAVTTFPTGSERRGLASSEQRASGGAGNLAASRPSATSESVDKHRVAASSGQVSAAHAPSATGGSGRLVAEARDPEEPNSYPAPPSVHHSAAKTPQAAGEAQVAAGAASDAEIRSELAKMKQVESAASQPAKMATVPGGNSIVGNDGAIAIPTDVPEVVQRVIAGANAIANFPYVYGGGHASFVDHAYDCSGSVSYALAAGGLLEAPETSGQLESWGASGPGKWITVYANAGHTYMYVNIGGAWMLYDTAGRSGVFASRWQPYPVDNAGYVARHWPGL